MSLNEELVTVIVVFFLIGLSGLAVHGCEFQSAEVTAQHERAAAEKKSDVHPEDRIAFMPPMGCGQYVQKCDAEKCKVYAVCADRSPK